MSSEKQLNPLTMSSQGVQLVHIWVQDRRFTDLRLHENSL